MNNVKVFGLMALLTGLVGAAIEWRRSGHAIGRLLLFLANESDGLRWPKEARAQLKSMQRDVVSLSDHATYLSNKITFLLDALLGSVTPNPDKRPIALSIGEPKHRSPAFVAEALAGNLEKMAVYPTTLGIPELREAIATFLGRLATYRYMDMHHVIGEALAASKQFIHAVGS